MGWNGSFNQIHNFLLPSHGHWSGLRNAWTEKNTQHGRKKKPIQPVTDWGGKDQRKGAGPGRLKWEDVHHCHYCQNQCLHYRCIHQVWRIQRFPQAFFNCSAQRACGTQNTYGHPSDPTSCHQLSGTRNIVKEVAVPHNNQQRWKTSYLASICFLNQLMGSPFLACTSSSHD